MYASDSSECKLLDLAAADQANKLEQEKKGLLTF
jgi:hypothetical protein